MKLFDKMCKFELDPAIIMKDTARTRFRPQTDAQTARQCKTTISLLSSWLKRGYNGES